MKEGIEQSEVDITNTNHADELPDFDINDELDTDELPDFDINDELDTDELPDFDINDELDTDELPDFDIKNESDADEFSNRDTRDNIKKYNTTNQDLEGGEHPKTGVPFVRKVITLLSGEKIEGVFPVFKSKLDVQLPNDKHKATDPIQANECNKQLKEWVKDNPEEAKEKFTEEQLEDIAKNRTPEGCTWHHNEEPGKMQLVDTETHSKTGHTGGRKIWGGGSDSR